MPLDRFPFLVPDLRDVIEILLVAFVIYRLLLFLAGTRALQILLGLLSLVLLYFVAVIFKLNMITTLLGLIFTYGAFAAVVVFQPELRQALARMGTSRAIRFLTNTDQHVVADEIADAVSRLARNGTGGECVCRSIGHGFHALFATARWGGDSPGQPDRRRRMRVTADAIPGNGQVTRYASSGGARSFRRDRCRRDRSVRGDFEDLDCNPGFAATGCDLRPGRRRARWQQPADPCAVRHV